ncbi:cdc42 homolog [Lingula anatina]|uniref:Cdc42 homolog n=1 Tax=Lingula anatina TaxID=7574 RepID=A0A1S3IUY3_LINAN|nr:cdc42 homolog [Lingula anatina]|eukprot:XP_013401883.1 cdc42 homolog [Lingula anatina]
MQREKQRSVKHRPKQQQSGSELNRRSFPPAMIDTRNKNHIKCMVIGDGAVGKTCMLVSYTTSRFPYQYSPTVLDSYTARVSVDGRPYVLELIDSAGQDDYQHIRMLSYKSVDIFLVCYSVVDPASFNNLKDKWIPEMKHYGPQGTPFVVVGAQADLREDRETVEKLHREKEKPVSFHQGEKLAKKFGADAFIECSSLTQRGLQRVFEQVIMGALSPRKTKKSSKPSKFFGMVSLCLDNLKHKISGHKESGSANSSTAGSDSDLVRIYTGNSTRR